MRNILLVAALVAVVTTGCETAAKHTLQPKLAQELSPATTITNTVWTTNTVVVPATDDDPVVVRQVIQPLHTVTVLPARLVTVTNGWEVRPEATAALGVATTVGNMVQPGAGALVGAIGTGLLGLLAAWKNKQAKDATDILVATVKGVDSYRRSVRHRQGDGTGIDEAALPALALEHGKLTEPQLKLLQGVLSRYTAEINP